ncbi:hypothetical protein RRG08_014501 [Elysia crispata]|uniref:Cytochrome P450 n=1 Tax=Elysia crispata TaxID=231223 RepID=A0AAE1CLM0_9GAST|nr:hypothetical protein RRG08_014501 [Elysia crispata]
MLVGWVVEEHNEAKQNIGKEVVGIVFANGGMWKEQRSLSIAILKSFGMGKSSLAHKISEEVNVYLDTLAALDGKPEDVRSLTGTSVSNVICSIVIGKRFEYEDPLFKSFVDSFSRQIAAFDNAWPVVVWPWLRFIPGNFLGTKTMNNCVQIIRKEFGDKFIELALKEDGEDAAPTFITSYLKEMEKAQKEGKDTTLSMEQLRVNIQQLVVAGTDTTSNTIMWFMVYLLHYPHVQNKVYQEICSVTGPDREPDIQDKVKLPYTNAVIMETQRLASILPQSVPHYCKAETIIQGYTIPAGTTVLPSLDSVLMDEETWEEPLKFRPERFLHEGRVVKPDAFIPFSTGPRICMAEALANMELFLYTTSLVKRFELLPCTTGQLPSRHPEDGMVSSPLPFKLRFLERSTP